MARPFLLYHWSPSTRRKQIIRYGLCPGKPSVDKAWHPPYVCLADSPSLAWSLSGQMRRNKAIPEWDLWMVWSNQVNHRSHRESRPKEFRVHERIYKRDLWLIGTRTQD